MASVAFAQTDSVAPIRWEKYSDVDEKVTVVLPKRPTTMSAYDRCSERMHDIYRAYADGAAYELTIFTNRKIGPRPKWCTEDADPYDGDALAERLKEIAVQKRAGSPARIDLQGYEAFRFTTENLTRVLVNDIDKNKRWIELEVAHYPDKVFDFDRFFGSLRLNDASGQDIRAGAFVTLGDEGVDAYVPAAPPASTSGAARGPGYTIIVNERPAYTENARKNKVQGHVTLKLTLLANGSVGNIEVVEGLPDGLTESAIYSARRIVFLPKRVDGKPVSVSVKLEYGFKLY
ncbi:MAG TPA: energy transducer TonB [Pyrinomonadaceae bacterium]|nr:energy transducer TonB [Pyrinomonadaceae bacterium]